ncbi:heat shock protein DDB_G0283913-like [Oscarella lobularis]|uniref:heat shock protein DDB_G0283913-like n=1 Tax=Oscarella lobularis TaxID=121494 RepID=UPI0033132C96
MQCQPHYDDYDLKIKMDSFKGLETSGWAVHKAKSEAGCEKGERSNSPTVFVAVVGLFSQGKTFVLNQLMDSKLLDGFVSHTEGLCMKTPLERSLRGFTFVDTAGFDFPIEDGAEFYEKQYFNIFMRDVIFNVANISIIVVNDVTLNDQIYLDAVRKNLKRMHMDTMAGERSGGEELSNSQDVSGKSDDDAIKKPFHKGSMFGELVVIHNFSLCQNLEQCKEAFRKQVSQNYKGMLRSAEVAEGPSSSLDRKVSYEFYFTKPSQTHTGMRHLFLGL